MERWSTDQVEMQGVLLARARVKEENECRVAPQPPPSKKAKIGKGVRGVRQLIESVHLGCLVASYHKHFNKYSMGRKFVNQLVPSAVWKSVYATFLEKYPDSSFQEESVKDRLRETLKELKSGAGNDDNANNNATLQPEPEGVLVQVRATEGDATRNVLEERQNPVDQTSPDFSSSDTSAPKDAASTGAASGGTSKGRSVASLETEKTKTKGEIYAEMACSIASLAETYAAGEKSRDTLVQLKIASERKRYQIYAAKIKSMRINDVLRLRDLGFYSEEEYRREMQNILESPS